MSQSFHGQAGTETKESIELTLETETFFQLVRRYKWTSRWLALQLFLLAMTATVPFLWPNGKELAGVVFGVGLTMTIFVAITGLVVGTVNAARRLYSAVRNSDAVAT
ncbi:hypothetical protein [Haloarchaeobius iranensis]|uniref:Uncharacterized protein n=1 Tax=Haloarchaeobius iranensis TaxID=996166 RepID=A0A1G9T638_9EURY|nr:hypothetical protein [Haloarchaeobius iranensis]SDM43092.1 hypothetical protein SAMN05192554_102154 [Haloarchaeobius iranensis]